MEAGRGVDGVGEGRGRGTGVGEVKVGSVQGHLKGLTWTICIRLYSQNSKRSC